MKKHKKVALVKVKELPEHGPYHQKHNKVKALEACGKDKHHREKK
jgi:hypothetical protein